MAYWQLDLVPTLVWVKQDWALFIVLCLASPLLEEYVFRGWIYEAARQHWPSAWPTQASISISTANLVTSGFFVVAHTLLREPLVGVMVLIPSLYLGLLRDRYNKVSICIGTHAFWNIGWFSFFSPL